MNITANYRVRINRNTVTRIHRSLSGVGKITVAVGQEVTPSDKIGSFAIKSGFRKVNISKLLSISPNDAEKLLQRKVGEKIFKGELLAFKKGNLLSKDKVLTSPSDGVIQSFNNKTGEVDLELISHEVFLPSAVFGIVEQVDQLRGEVVIKTEATEIFGLLGSGKRREGVIKILGRRGSLINKTNITPALKDSILAIGGLMYSEALIKAVGVGVHGIITGGVNAKDYKSMAGGGLLRSSMTTDIGLSFIITEGFGPVPIGEDIFEVFELFKDRFAILDGNRAKLILPSFDSSSMLRIKKTQLPAIQSMVESLPEVEVRNLNVGERVRVVGSKFTGEQGKIIGIDSTATVLPSKVVTYMILVESRSRKFKVPYTNLEIIN